MVNLMQERGHSVFLSEGQGLLWTPAHDLTSLATGPNRTRNPRVTGHHSLTTAGSQSLGWRQRAVNTLCCLPRPRGRSLRTPRRESTWERVRGWMTKSRRNRPLGRNRPALVDSTGQASPDPATDDLEMRASPGEVSPGLAIRRVEPLSPGQEHLGLAVTIGNLEAQSLDEVCMVRAAWASMPSPLTEDFLDSYSIYDSSFPESAESCISFLWEGMLGSSVSSSLNSLLELHDQGDSADELLLDPQEHAEPGEAEPQSEEDWAAGPALAQLEVAPVECVPAPLLAPSSALTPQPEPAPGAPSPPAAQLGVPTDARQASVPELQLGQTTAPPLPFPSITTYSPSVAALSGIARLGQEESRTYPGVGGGCSPEEQGHGRCRPVVAASFPLSTIQIFALSYRYHPSAVSNLMMTVSEEAQDWPTSVCLCIETREKVIELKETAPVPLWRKEGQGKRRLVSPGVQPSGQSFPAGPRRTQTGSAPNAWLCPRREAQKARNYSSQKTVRAQEGSGVRCRKGTRGVGGRGCPGFEWCVPRPPGAVLRGRGPV
ncbi:uncharacterized protein LOC104850340 [Fukomys damarensis]|uniref:uncharacterized protein LOC104850340 n=1 Tax=Fukomys damarensis TaxID=885580 RepID=UPI00053FE880|nr:uncharacterized protein LOC104850340 [Fukomys damarensis]